MLTAAEDTIKGLLPVLDDCERAIDVLKSAEGDHKAAIEGTELIYNKLYTYLESKGLKKMEVKERSWILIFMKPWLNFLHLTKSTGTRLLMLPSMDIH